MNTWKYLISFPFTDNLQSQHDDGGKRRQLPSHALTFFFENQSQFGQTFVQRFTTIRVNTAYFKSFIGPNECTRSLVCSLFFRSPQTLVMTSLKSAWEHERNCYFMSRAINLSIKRATGWSQQRHVAHVASALSW